MPGAVTRSLKNDFILGVTIPDPTTNVGVYADVPRTTYSGPTTITTDGTTVENKDITQYITINAADVSFVNCYFSAGGDLVTGGMVNCQTANCSNIRFYRCTFLPSTMSDRRDAVYGHDFTVERCHIERTVDGFGIANQYSSLSNVNLLGNWIGNLAWFNDDRQGQGNGGHSDGSHNDGVQIHSGTNVHIIGNTFYGYKYNALGTPALDGSANNRHPQMGQIVLAQTQAYFHDGDIHINNNFIYGGDQGFVFHSTCNIGAHGGHKFGFDVEIKNNTWMDNGQRNWGGSFSYYLIRTDDNMTLNGLGPFPTSGKTDDVNGNHWYGASTNIPAIYRDEPIFIRCDDY